MLKTALACYYPVGTRGKLKSLSPGLSPVLGSVLEFELGLGLGLGLGLRTGAGIGLGLDPLFSNKC